MPGKAANRSIEIIEVGSYVGEVYQPPLDNDELARLALEGVEIAPFAEKIFKINHKQALVRMFRRDYFGGYVSLGDAENRMEHFRAFASRNADLLIESRHFIAEPIALTDTKSWLTVFANSERQACEDIMPLKKTDKKTKKKM